MTCSQCRDIRSLTCIQFKSTFTLLLKSAEEKGNNYWQNFVTDYFNLSEITLENFWMYKSQMKSRKKEKKQKKIKKKKKTFDKKSKKKKKKITDGNENFRRL